MPFDPRHFAKFVLSHIKKHGDNFDQEQAHKLLAQIEEVETESKSPEIPKTATPPRAAAQVDTDKGK